MKLTIAEEVQQCIDHGLINVNEHPKIQDLKILSYTNKATADGTWGLATRMCRGLIIHGDIDTNAEIISNPPPKFFNHTEELAEQIDLWDKDTKVLVKEDGYFISVTLTKWGLVVSSRGAFCNQYTEKAEELLKPYIELFELGKNYFFELCADFRGDENIIVTRHPEPYIKLWAIRTPNGEELPLDPRFPCVEELYALIAKYYLDTKVEGIVLVNNAKRVKMKTEWFLERHRLISHCTPKRAWWYLLMKEPIPEDIPEEHMKRMKEFTKTWEDVIAEETKKAQVYVDKYKDVSNKEFATLDIPTPYKSYAFALRRHNIDKLRFQILQNNRPIDIIEDKGLL